MRGKAGKRGEKGGRRKMRGAIADVCKSSADGLGGIRIESGGGSNDGCDDDGLRMMAMTMIVAMAICNDSADAVFARGEKRGIWRNGMERRVGSKESLEGGKNQRRHSPSKAMAAAKWQEREQSKSGKK